MTRLGIIVVTLTALLLSLSSIFSRFTYDAGANPQTLVFLRFVLFCLLYTLIIVVSSQNVRLAEGKRLFAYVAGGFYTLGSGCLLASMFYLPVSLAIVVFYTYPILTMMGEKILDRQQPRLFEISCFMLAFFGLVLALNIETYSVNPIGVALAITASFSMSTSYLISDRKLKSVPPFQLTFHLALTGLLIMLMFVLLTGSFQIGAINVSNISAVFLASLCFALAFFLMFKGINLIGAVKTSMILNLEPVFTVGLAFLFLKETLTAIQLTGAGLVLAAIILIQRFESLQHNQG